MFNISKSLDIDMLERNVRKASRNLKQEVFVIMNEDTLKSIIEQEKISSIPNNKYGVFNGMPVAVCGKLNFGEIEIR